MLLVSHGIGNEKIQVERGNIVKKRATAIIIATVLIVALVITVFVINSGAERPLSIQELLETAERYLLEGNFEQAIVEFKRVIEIDPVEPRGYTGAAEAYVGLGRIDDAIDILHQGLVMLPDNLELREMLEGLLRYIDEPESLSHIHNWIEANCQEPRRCADCDETEGNVGAHIWSFSDIFSPKNCVVCRETDGISIGQIEVLIRTTEYWRKGMCTNDNFMNTTYLRYMINLQELSLVETSVSDLSPLVGLPNLTRLDLHSFNLYDITPIACMTNLTHLSLWGNFSDITPIAGLTNLESLYLNWSQISDISALAGLTNLSILYLNENSISDLTPLAGLTNLTELILSGNQISDLTPLAGLSSDVILDLTDNPITDWSPVDHIAYVRGRP